MRTSFFVAAMLSVLLVAGCDSTESPKPPGERMFDSQRQALEKAQEVEGIVQQQADRQRQQIDRESR